MKTDEPEFIIGRHPAVMALKSDQEINKVFIQKDLKADIIGQIVKLAKERHLVISNVPKNKLDQMTNHQNHQGVALAIAAYRYATIDDLFANADDLNAYLAAQYAAGTPVQIAYKLATPTPIVSTGAQPIPALIGVNTIITDVDSVTVTGRADPIKRITDLEDAVASMTTT